MTYNCNMSVMSKQKLTSLHINQMKFEFQTTSECCMANQHFRQCIGDLTRKP